MLHRASLLVGSSQSQLTNGTIVIERPLGLEVDRMFVFGPADMSRVDELEDEYQMRLPHGIADQLMKMNGFIGFGQKLSAFGIRYSLSRGLSLSSVQPFSIFRPPLYGKDLIAVGFAELDEAAEYILYSSATEEIMIEKAGGELTSTGLDYATFFADRFKYLCDRLDAADGHA